MGRTVLRPRPQQAHRAQGLEGALGAVGTGCHLLQQPWKPHATSRLSGRADPRLVQPRWAVAGQLCQALAGRRSSGKLSIRCHGHPNPAGALPELQLRKGRGHRKGRECGERGTEGLGGGTGICWGAPDDTRSPGHSPPRTLFLPGNPVWVSPRHQPTLSPDPRAALSSDDHRAPAWPLPAPLTTLNVPKHLCVTVK